MNLQRCRILGFGKLSSLELCFHAGLNLVFAPNEAGKSTLQQFLLGLLFGPLRDDVPHQRRLEAWVEKFTPWRNAEYGGILWCRLANGRDLEIHRAFAKEDSRAEIRTAGGEDITGSYEHRKNGDVVFAGAHLGMTKDLFESLAVVRENRASDFHGPETIRDRKTAVNVREPQYGVSRGLVSGSKLVSASSRVGHSVLLYRRRLHHRQALGLTIRNNQSIIT